MIDTFLTEKMEYGVVETKSGVVYVNKREGGIFTVTKEKSLRDRGLVNPFTGKRNFFGKDRERGLEDYLKQCNDV